MFHWKNTCEELIDLEIGMSSVSSDFTKWYLMVNPYIIFFLAFITNVTLCFLFFFEVMSLYIHQPLSWTLYISAGLKFIILLSQSPDYYDYNSTSGWILCLFLFRCLQFHVFELLTIPLCNLPIEVFLVSLPYTVLPLGLGNLHLSFVPIELQSCIQFWHKSYVSYRIRPISGHIAYPFSIMIISKVL